MHTDKSKSDIAFIRVNLRTSVANDPWRLSESGVAYSIQYLLAVDSAVMTTWLSRFNGCLDENVGTIRPIHGSFEFREGLVMRVEIIETTTQLCFPQLLYSHFLFAGPVISSWVDQIELRLCQDLVDVPIIRADELLFGEWVNANARDWFQIPRPFESLKKWLAETQDDTRYYRVFGAVEKCN